MNHAPAPTPTGGVAAASAMVLLLGAAAALLTVAGRSLPFPASWSPTGLRRWVGATDPAVVAFTVLRAVGIALVAWIALTWLLAVLTRLAGVPSAVRAADGLTLPFVRRLAEATAGAAFVATSFVSAAHAGATTPDLAPLVVMSDLGPTSPGTTTTTTHVATATTALDAATSTTVAPVNAPAPTLAAPPSMTALDQVPAAPARPPAAGTATTDHVGDGVWVIRPGDTLWHMAEQTAADGLGRPATLAETAAQLDRLIWLNADRLAVPGDADLVFPGQEFLVR